MHFPDSLRLPGGKVDLLPDIGGEVIKLERPGIEKLRKRPIPQADRSGRSSTEEMRLVQWVYCRASGFVIREELEVQCQQGF
jgi:hypothetical protein